MKIKFKLKFFKGFNHLILTNLVLVVMGISTSQAGLETLIKNVMPAGTMSNITQSAIVQEQSAGHIMGGSVIIKSPAEPGLNLIHAKAPSCKMGGLPCGAQFEILGGGVSVINSEALMLHLKGMAQNAATYGGMMAIKTLCPQCEDLMSWLDSKADWINGLAKTDCEDMARLADGMLGRITAGARATRQSAAVLSGRGKDMADFASKSKEETDDPTGGRADFESLLGDNYNLVWKALSKKAPGGGEGISLKEVLMSISGTIIGIKDADGRRSVIHKRSLVNKELIEDFIGARKGDKEINLYACNEPELCLAPTIRASAVRAKDSLKGRVEDLLVSISNKIKVNKGSFTADEETLIAMSSLSLITKIELDLSTYSNEGNALAAQSEFVEALCFDVVTTYLAKLLSEVQTAVGEIQYAQIADSGVFDKFDAETREIMRALSQAKNETFKRYDIITQTKARLRQEIAHYEMEFEEFLSNQNEN